jgi:hypothetical protein
MGIVAYGNAWTRRIGGLDGLGGGSFSNSVGLACSGSEDSEPSNDQPVNWDLASYIDWDTPTLN